MGLVSYLCDIWKKTFSGGTSVPEPSTPKKRRGDDICRPDSKLRRLEDSNYFGERFYRESVHQTNRREAHSQPRDQVKLGAVHISKWGLNGKENHVLPFPPFNSVKASTTMGLCQKAGMDEIQVLEDHNKSRARNSLNLAGAPYYETGNRNGSDDEIVELSPPAQSSFGKKEVEVIKIVQSPQVRRKDDNDVQIVKQRISLSKEGRSSRNTPLGRKPFKTISPAVQASSTPILFTSRQPLIHAPEQPEVEILPSTSNGLANGMDSCRYRSQSSILSSDSNSSRKNSTLLHMKRAEESERYEKLLKSYGSDRLFPQRIKTANVSTHLDPGEKAVSLPRVSLSMGKSFRNSPTDDRTPTGLTLSSFVKDAASPERINIQVGRVHENEPSTSASRHQSDDADLQYLGEVSTLTYKVIEPSVHTLEEILEKYEKINQERWKQIEKESQTSRLLGERNRLLSTDHHKRITDEIADQINAYLKVVDEPELAEEEEKIPALPELTDEMNAEINRALAAPPDAVLANAFNLTIKGRDMRTLKDLAWLNDEVINFYMNLIIERGKADNYPSVHAFNTFFFPKLISSGYDALKRWTKKVDIFAHDYILVPVHRGMHWCMAIIDMKEKVVRYYDSMDGKFPQCMDALLNYLQKESLDKKKQPFNTTGWVKEHAEGIPQQNNGSDCGMFACMYAEYVSRGAAITFTQEHMPYFRRKAVYEILKAKLLC